MNLWTQMKVEILGKFSHPNIVKLLGNCCKKDREFPLVYEYMLNGSLDCHLFRIGTARGHSFLYATENQVIVRDIKSKNILLDGDFNAKLSGFGCAKRYPENGESHVSTRVIGGYPAPEYIATGYLYPESDVYGFGVVLLELLTGLRVLDRNKPTKKINLVAWAKPLLPRKKNLRILVDPRLENDYPPQEAFELASLIP
ncbi:hypothetical protein LguiA_001631 [Lonicera macranthoides]